MHILLTGATGLVGSAALSALLRHEAVTKITIFTRRPVAQATESTHASKCNIITHPDFTSPPTASVLQSLKDSHGCIWALGVSQTEVDGPTYEKITKDWPLRWARAFASAGLGQQNGKNSVFNFVYVSGEGATTSPGFMTARFGRIKGETESALLELMSEPDMAQAGLKVFSARPGGVDQAGHQEVEKYAKKRQGWLGKVEKPMMSALRVTMKSLMAPTRALGDALVSLAVGSGEPLQGVGVQGNGRTLANVRLRTLGNA